MTKMGLANIATQISGPLGLVLGGIMIDVFRAMGEAPLGPRVGIALGIVALIGAAILLLGVRPVRGPRTVNGEVSTALSP